MSNTPSRRFAAAWRELRPAFRRALELSYQTLAAGGLSVGAVRTDPTGRIVAEGRNRAVDLVTEGRTAPELTRGQPLTAVLTTLWDRLAGAATSRARRTG